MKEFINNCLCNFIFLSKKMSAFNMKKILVIFILFTFCSNQTALAVYEATNTKFNQTKGGIYMSEKTGITKEVAISLTHNVNVENNPILVEIYNIVIKNPEYSQNDISSILSSASKSEEPMSIKRALETNGLMPKYVGPRYFVLDKPEHLNNIIDTYLLLKNYGISDKDMSNILSIYTSNHKQAPIPIQLVNGILNDNSIQKEDKVYYIYAKLYGLTEKNPKIEEDMINSYNIMKKYPKIFKKDSDKTNHRDDVYWVMQYYVDKCKTTEILTDVMNDSSIKDDDKIFRVLGRLKALTLKEEEKAENKKYPSVLYKMAEEGKPILTYFWENNARRYYTNEKVLTDVYNAYTLLMKANIDDITGDEGKSILTLHPELCKAEEVTKEVLNDAKIAQKDKAKIIGRRLEREYYNRYGKKSEAANTAIEMGIVPKYTQNNLDEYKYDVQIMTNNIQAYELMKKNIVFNDNDIEKLINKNGYGADDQKFNLYESVKKVVNNNKIQDKDKPNQVFREFLLTQNNDNNVKLFDAGIISLDNELYKDRFYTNRGDEQTQRIIRAYNLMKKAGFSEKDIIYIIDDEVSNEYIDKAVEEVIADSSIQKTDKFVFVNANLKRHEALNQKDMPQSYYKAVENNIIPLYFNDFFIKEADLYEKLIENVYIMRDELGYTGYQVKNVLSLARDNDLHYISSDVEMDVINKILKDETIVKDDKVNKIEKELRKVNSKELSKENSLEVMHKAGRTALIIVTAPIWLPVVIVLSPFILLFMHDINKHGWH